MSPAKSYSKEERKLNGIFYTPQFLADFLAKKVLSYFGKPNKPITIVDPACGDGILLQSMVRRIRLKWKKRESIKIIGVDRDINAITNCTENFSRRNVMDGFSTNFINTDGLFPLGERISDSGWNRLKTEIGPNNIGGFDVCVSNPPWGAELDGYDRDMLDSSFALAKGQFDIYDLFVEVILNNLNDGGIYGLILPDSIFSHEHSRLRFLLADNSTLLLIGRLGEKIFHDINRACVVVVGIKGKTNIGHKVDCFRLSPGYRKQVLKNKIDLEQAERDLSHEVPQRRFMKNDNCVFDIDLKIVDQNTFLKIHKTKTQFRDIVYNARGVELSKKGIVCKCPKCLNWMPYPRSKLPKCISCGTGLDLGTLETEQIILSNVGNDRVKLKVGEDLYRYTSISRRWIDITKGGINYKDSELYEGKKILVRKTGIGITACLDYDNSMTNQVVYMLKLRPAFDDILTLEFVLAVLNSRAITFYLIKKYGENEWKSHAYITQGIIKHLPFPDIDYKLTKNREAIRNVTNIIANEIPCSAERNISRSSDIIIERTIADFFGLNRQDYRVIFKTLRLSEQLVPIKRLLEIGYEEMY